MSAIDDLERKVRSLRDQLRAAEVSLREARMNAAGVEPGDLVDVAPSWPLHAPWGGPYRVARVFVLYDSVSFTYNEKNKGGEWSKRERKLYGKWRHHTPDTEAP